MSRRDLGAPVWVDPDGAAVLLERVQLTSHETSEGWIQSLLFDHPEVLPVAEIDSSFAPLIPVGREFPSGRGPIDALFISPNGTLTIVEAKLWRNPEARRQVVGQILDYASALAGWTFEDFDRAVAGLLRCSLWETVLAADVPIQFETEDAFVDAVTRNLRTGKFLLLVVGDGIREEMERIAPYIQTTPHLQFSLALVELRIHEHPGTGGRIVVPSVVARTTEVTRAVVEVSVAPEASVNVRVAVPVDDSLSGRRKMNEEVFFAELSEQIDQADVEFVREAMTEFSTDDRFLVEWKSASFVVKLLPLIDGQPALTLLVFNREGTVYPGWLSEQLPRNGVPAEMGYRYVEELARILNARVHHRLKDSLAKPVPARVVSENWPAVRGLIETFRDGVIVAFSAG